MGQYPRGVNERLALRFGFLRGAGIVRIAALTILSDHDETQYVAAAHFVAKD